MHVAEHAAGTLTLVHFLRLALEAVSLSGGCSAEVMHLIAGLTPFCTRTCIPSLMFAVGCASVSGSDQPPQA